MIELFKMIKGIYDLMRIPCVGFRELSEDLIRNRYKLIQNHYHYNLRIFNFTDRVIPMWNSLSDHVVSAETDNIFKNQLDRFFGLIRMYFMITEQISMASGTALL